jgi:glycosyltransferase involved in cell wall biosynthesis
VKITYVHGICMQHDAISNAIRDEVEWLMVDHDVRLFTYACDHAHLPGTTVQDINQLVLNEHFQQSDLIVFHFGVYYPLFDAILACPSKARRLVIFHNITTKEYVQIADHETVDRSFAQLSNLVFANHVVCDSHTNLAVMRAAGVTVPATVLPLALHSTPTPPQLKPSCEDGIVRVAFVGRFVKSKGVGELLAAVDALLLSDAHITVQLDLVGNMKFSDASLLEALRLSIARLSVKHGDRVTATIHGSATDELKSALLRDADLFILPTYHEGFCVPILEALASGCRVISYDNSNVPAISGGLATLVPTGDVAALTTALATQAGIVVSDAWRAGGADSYAAYSARASAYVAAFEPARIRSRFLTFIRGFSRSLY